MNFRPVMMSPRRWNKQCHNFHRDNGSSLVFLVYISVLGVDTAIRLEKCHQLDEIMILEFYAPC